jgi:hypothetical protein
MAQSIVKVELAAELERARARLARNADSLRHDLDIGTHFKQSFHENKAAYIGGAALFGLALSKITGRGKRAAVEKKSKSKLKEAEKAGAGILLLEFALNLLRPLLASLLSKQVTEFVRSRSWKRDPH